MRSASALIVALACATAVHAQMPPLSLKPANAKATEEFSRLASLRELADGRVLVVDDKEGRFGVLDFSAATFAAIGRKGRGPGEYSQLGRIFPVGGDTTLAGDFGKSAQIHVIVGDKIVTALPPDNPAIRGSYGFPNGADRRGFVSRTLSARGPTDSSTVVNIHRASGKVDTVARLGSVDVVLTGMAAKAAAMGRGAAGPGRHMMSMQARDVATFLSDGWTAIVRVRPYRVDWCSPDAQCKQGPVLASTMASLSDDDKRVYMAYTRATADWPKTDKLEETSGWPDRLPPFVASAMGLIDPSPITALPDGRILVQRTPTAAAPKNNYDVIDRAGRVSGRIPLGFEQRIVGFGARSVYMATTDDDGIQQLARHPWP